MPMPPTRRLAALATALVTVLGGAGLLAGCGAEDDPQPASGDETAVSIEITIEGDSVEPRGERIDVEVGQEIELQVQADRAGELHVHATPEQSLEYGDGATALTITLDQPGVVDVETHDPAVVVVQLEAR